MANYCIICGKEKKGFEVKEDYIIKSIRWFKKNITKNEEGNKLVVCKECLPKYIKYRNKFVLREIIYLLLGFLFLIFGLIISFKVSTLLISFVIIVFLYLLSLISYMPELKQKIRNNKQIYTLPKK
ncbi:MAG: hypothetical protein ACP5RT_00870 [Candidatus Micrarchaeia archaeon]